MLLVFGATVRIKMQKPSQHHLDIAAEHKSSDTYLKAVKYHYIFSTLNKVITLAAIYVISKTVGLSGIPKEIFNLFGG